MSPGLSPTRAGSGESLCPRCETGRLALLCVQHVRAGIHQSTQHWLLAQLGFVLDTHKSNFPAPPRGLRAGGAQSLLTPYNTALCSRCLHFNVVTSCEREWCHRWEKTKIRGCPAGHSKGSSVEIKGPFRKSAL